MSHTQNKMAVRPILPLLLTMAFPAMLSMFIQSLYNIVDSMFIAQFSTDALTAVSLAFPIQNLILAFAVGTGVGINAVVARKLGEQNFNDANSAATHGLLLALATSAVFMTLSCFFIQPFFKAFTDSPVIFDLGVQYTSIITFLSFGIIIHIAIEKILQATGKMIFPMIFQAVGAIVNIILDPILIFGLVGFPALGIEGAAWATIIGQFSAMLLALITLFFAKNDVTLSFQSFRFNFKIIKDIYAVGIPVTLIYSLGSILVIGLNAILIAFSEAAVALLGIFFKLQSFIFMPVLGLTQGAMPIIGYNYGARKTNRLFATCNWSLLVSTLITFIGTSLFIFFPHQLLGFFGASKEMLELGAIALPILGLSFIPAGISLIYTTVFQAVNRGSFALITALLRQTIIILPLAFIFAPMYGITSIWLTFIIAECLAAIVAWLLFHNLRKKDDVLNPKYITTQNE